MIWRNDRGVIESVVVMDKQMRKRLILVILLHVGVIILGGLLYLKYDRAGDGVPCQIYKYTGFYCPSCGVTRMMYALIHDHDILRAFRYNALLAVTLPFAAVLYIQQLIVFLRTGGLSPWMGPVAEIWGILMILFGILRNIPAFWFLAPMGP